ncbi:AbrB/MazE/SpoVT family DNA-binding domain-containing protein [Nanoarchaeota archaeon]
MKSRNFQGYSAKWGNCLAIRIPNNVVKELGLEPDTPVDIKLTKTPKGDATQQLLTVLKKLNPSLKKFSDQEILNSFVMSRYEELTGSKIPEKYKNIQEEVSSVLGKLNSKQ